MKCYTVYRPSDRVQKKMENYAEFFRQYYAEESDNCAEKMPDYAEISKINKTVPFEFFNVKIHLNVFREV